jgi:hypothetical protein
MKSVKWHGKQRKSSEAGIEEIMKIEEIMAKMAKSGISA